MHHHRGFTLAELLIVITVLAILGTATLIILNPAQILAQQRDSNRVSDLNSLSVALQDYQSVVGGSMGATGTIYISIPDPSATTTAGDQCQGLGLATSSSYTWHCAASSTYRNTDGTGWIPVNFKAIGSVPPITLLSTDPANTTSSGYFYAYSTSDGTHYEVTALPESQKQKTTLDITPQLTAFPGIFAAGSSPNASLLFNPNGLYGYWAFEEGTGTTAMDTSGNNSNGSWVGAGTHYSAPGKVGAYAGSFNGSTVYADIPGGGALNTISGDVTLAAWVKPTVAGGTILILGNDNGGGGWGAQLNMSGSNGNFAVVVGGSAYSVVGSALTNGAWSYLVGVRSGTTLTIYVNGVPTTGSTAAGNLRSSGLGRDSIIGDAYPAAAFFSGQIDDARIYNRALSASEVAALYNSQK